MDSVFSYTDYRALLRDLYTEWKKKKPFFSYRYIGQKVGFKSAGFFTNIIAGRRNISSEFIFRFTELFNFNKKETAYFETLVLYDQAKQHSQKRYYYEKLLSMMKSEWHRLAAGQYEYFDKWYYVAVREILGFYPFTGDYRELSRMVRPAITPREAKQAVDLLKRLDLVRKKDDGTFEVTDRAVTTVPHVPLVAVHNFQLASMDLAKEAIDRIPQDERSISTLTFSASKKTYSEIEKRLTEFRQEVRELIKNDNDPDNTVYQFNFQCFPLSQNHGDPAP